MAQWTWDTEHFTFDNADNHTFDGFHAHDFSTNTPPGRTCVNPATDRSCENAATNRTCANPATNRTMIS